MRFPPLSRRLRRGVALAAVTALGAGALSVGLAGSAHAASFVTGQVVDSAGRPIYNASVTLYNATTSDYVTGGETDADGGFKLFTSVPSVKAQFAVYTDGGSDLDDPKRTYAPEWYNDKATMGTSDPIAVGATDLGAITLSAGGSISGVVTNDAGAPLSRVAVDASGDIGGYGSDYTDANGAYTIIGLPPANYEVEFFDTVREHVAETYNDVKVGIAGTPTPVAVGKDAAVGGINAALTPNGVVPVGVDLTGRVVDSAGVPGAGVSVAAYTIGPRTRDGERVEVAVTNRQGVYTFTRLDLSGQTQFRLVAYGYRHEIADFARSMVWSGGSQTYEGAAPVAITPGVPAAGPDLVPPVSGGVSGSIASEATGPTAAGIVQLLDEEGNFVTAQGTYTDGTFESRTVQPGTYHVFFDAEDLAAEWWNNAALREKAKTIVVKPGAMVTGLNASLAPALKVIEKPEINGVPIVGKPLKVTSGTWNQQDGSTFKYEWLSSGAVVGTGDTFTPSKALVGKKLQVRVTNQPSYRVYLPASVTTKNTPKVGFKSKFKAKIKGKKATFTVKNKKVKSKKIKGKVVAQLKDKEGKLTKILGKAKIKKGKGSMSLTKLLKKVKGDRKKVVFTFIAKTKKVGSAIVTKKVKKK